MLLSMPSTTFFASGAMPMDLAPGSVLNAAPSISQAVISNGTLISTDECGLSKEPGSSKMIESSPDSTR